MLVLGPRQTAEFVQIGHQYAASLLVVYEKCSDFVQSTYETIILPRVLR